MENENSQSESELNDFSFVGLSNGWTVGRFAALERQSEIRHAVTTRRGPDVVRVRTDHEYTAGEMSAALGLKEVAWLDQIHSGDVLEVHRGGLAGRADAMLTDKPSLGLVGRSADCPLILTADPTTGVVGMAHASWRGTVQQITRELVLRSEKLFRAGPDKTIACICPSAGPCCYEVGRDVLEAAMKGIGTRAEQFFIHRGGKMFFDLWAANVDQLLRCGVKFENIHIANYCTMCHNDFFPSHRLEGQTAGRFVAIIARR